MGNILKVLWKDNPSTENDDYVFVDFEAVTPTSDEKPVYDRVQMVLEDSHRILSDVEKYAGATEYIRNAISNPNNNDIQEVAWKEVCNLAARLRTYYEFSQRLGEVVPELLDAFNTGDITPKQHLETQQALFKQFAEILDFVLKFDEKKMTNPALQNDFSYYRRTLSRTKKANDSYFHPKSKDDNGIELIVDNDMANRMSLFYANPTPMLKVLSDATTSFVTINKNLPIENTTDCLGTMAKICRVMIATPEYVSRFQKTETQLFCLRVMVGVIILYDHVHPVGAFAKSSAIEMKSSVKLLKESSLQVDGLINALRFTTKHLHDESTPKAIKELLD